MAAIRPNIEIRYLLNFFFQDVTNIHMIFVNIDPKGTLDQITVRELVSKVNDNSVQKEGIDISDSTCSGRSAAVGNVDKAAEAYGLITTEIRITIRKLWQNVQVKYGSPCSILLTLDYLRVWEKFGSSNVGDYTKKQSGFWSRTTRIAS